MSVDCGGELVILDAGSGIIDLGSRLSRQGGPKRINILISHVHLDHISGLVGFQPFHNPDADIHIYGEARDGRSFRSQLENIINPPYWPVGLRDFRAGITIHEIAPGQRFLLADEVAVDTLESSHPNRSLIYRLEGMGRRIVYTLDCELEGGMAERLTAFAADCGLLVWDANFTEADIIGGWGHSTWEQGAALGRAANAGLTLMTHFSNTYTDVFLREQERLATEAYSAVRFAREGMEIVL